MSDKALNIELMSLKFFSSRFLIRKPFLEYGIVLKTNKKTAEIEQIPAILIKDTRLFINIWKDRLESRISDDYRFQLFPCEFLQNETDYIFRTGEYEATLNKMNVNLFYSDKVFSPSSGRLPGTDRFLTNIPVERVPNDD